MDQSTAVQHAAEYIGDCTGVQGTREVHLISIVSLSQGYRQCHLQVESLLIPVRERVLEEEDNGPGVSLPSHPERK